jgi:hypothetical protein
VSERIDHVRLAQRFVGGESPLVDGSFDQTRDYIAAAQVHATLALVEQQRIANLIALADHAHGRFGNNAGEAGGVGVLFSYGETPDSNMRVRQEIREGLGL